ncbi:hypothetical protein DPMN_096536 [Dreissena polymorpha]|uniref:Uncharacterized protein n=1 Tax=Dreissena polymorpha TaxID=45954 RepID=A0A9D4R4U2_DREPO|nr:hypothetical protein DPMN_096536 [Dreissena polymorpha]
MIAACILPQKRESAERSRSKRIHAWFKQKLFRTLKTQHYVITRLSVKLMDAPQ